MPSNTKPIKTDASGKPVPQVFDASADDYQVAAGTQGRQHVIIYDDAGVVVPLNTALQNIATAVAQPDSRDLRGTLGSRPAANTVAAGTTYWALDRIGQADEFTVSDASTWTAF